MSDAEPNSVQDLNHEVNLTPDVDWVALRAAAVAAMKKAYCPYSHFPVGAAAIVDDGRIVTGCNVENAGYGVCLCAECGVISQLHITGGGRLVAFTCVDGRGEVCMPCGRCRQILFEHGGKDMLMETPQGVMTLDQVLPQGFGPEALDLVAQYVQTKNVPAQDAPEPTT
ncbi:MAG: cytidine deaminase [Cellulomonadaceae bacterium]|jgi:cytidine deaminase|nr:cytidine deaminase [Cellulomonadaceae bacterium]